MEDIVHFEVADARSFYRKTPAGRIALNPPYGERLLDREETEQLYLGLSAAFERLGPGWELHILTAFSGFETLWGSSANKRRKLYNGMLKCQLYSYTKEEIPPKEKKISPKNKDFSPKHREKNRK